VVHRGEDHVPLAGGAGQVAELPRIEAFTPEALGEL
jgi:hypothetical protein